MIHPAYVVRLVVATVLTTATAAGCGAAAEPSAVSTPLATTECIDPPADLALPYAARDLGVQQCPALEPWRLLVVASDANTWIDLVGPGVSWSAERAIVYEAPIGHFPSVDPSAGAEWRRRGRRPPTALIVRVTAQDPEAPDASRSALYVIRLSAERVCLIGREATLEDARTRADSDAGCAA